MKHSKIITRNNYVAGFSSTPIGHEITGEGSQIIWKNEQCQINGSCIKSRASDVPFKEAIESGKWGIVDATSGNTGIAIAARTAQEHLECCIVMPDNVSQERINTIMEVNFRAEIILTPADEGLDLAIKTAKRFASKANYYYLNQFHNASCVRGFGTVAGEVIDQAKQKISDKVVVVTAVGTGATLRGYTTSFLNANIEATACAARMIEENLPGTTPEGFSNHLLDFDHHTQWVEKNTVLETWREIVKRGYHVGPTSALNLAAARMYAHKNAGNLAGATIVTAFIDPLDRYYSLPVYEEAFGIDHNLERENG